MVELKKFNPYAMRGVTEEDNVVIRRALQEELDLNVDQFGRVWVNDAKYIADAICVVEGIACE